MFSFKQSEIENMECSKSQTFSFQIQKNDILLFVGFEKKTIEDSKIFELSCFSVFLLVGEKIIKIQNFKTTNK